MSVAPPPVDDANLTDRSPSRERELPDRPAWDNRSLWVLWGLDVAPFTGAEWNQSKKHGAAVCP